VQPQGLPVHSRPLSTATIRARCTSLVLCWINALNEGLRGGDIGGIMDPAIQQEDALQYAYVVAYQLSFFAIVITVLLNVIFGIIIDTFAELRTESANKKDNMENVCFVCGLDRFTFDTKGGGFEPHIWEDHNMWKYLFMHVHLRGKDVTELNGWEAYVLSLLASEEVSFLPRNTAIVLRDFKEKEEQEQRRQLHQLEQLSQSQAEMMRRLDALTKAVDQTLKLDEVDKR